ncbi:MAG: DinB family protein [Candidatus Thorarchaeota archaeon]
MKEQLKRDLSSGLYGTLTHLHPKKAVDGLTPSMARKRPSSKYHSCWDLLHHTVFWQDIILKNLEGEYIDWNSISNDDNWPSDEFLSQDRNFIELVKKFDENLKIAVSKLENIDLMEEINIGSERTLNVRYFRLFLVFLQHTSYHLGQIVTTRKLLGDWKED